MMNVILYISIVFILGGYIFYFFLIFIGRRKEIEGYNGFDITKDIISVYNSINVIENGGYFTIYNLKRKVIKIASDSYYGNDLSSLCLSLMEAGISIVDNAKNKYIDVLRVFFSNIKILYIFPLIGLFISNSSFNINDAKFGIILMLFFSLISYFILCIKENGCDLIYNNINNIDNMSKENMDMIISFMKKMLMCDKLIFYGELLIIIRLFIMMIGI